jgi:alkaline phosphatase D
VLTRRRLLQGSLAALGASAGGSALGCAGRAPRAVARRPAVSHGVAAGDVHADRALVWARADEPARMLIEWDTTPAFARPRRVAGPVVTPASDLTATVALTGLPAGQTIAYRVRFEREAARGASEWVAGRLATPRADRVRVAWTGDTCGQGWGRNPDWGGLRGYAAVRAADPAIFINSGDLIYADNPILPEQRTPDGRVWRNVTTEQLARVAESLADFRARFAYVREDEHARELAAQVATITQWDDHETRNNWWPGQVIDDPRYRERDASRLAARALRATREWSPLPPGPVHRVIRHGPLLDIIVLDCRSFRGPNTAGTEPRAAMLGAAQARWLVDALAASTARWRLVACDQPIGLVIRDGEARQEGFANGDAGPPRGRERELADALAAAHARGVRNVAWVTADVHYAAAHHYDPQRARDVPLTPFWELVAGPIHAGTFGPEALDPSLGGEVRFQWAPPPGAANLPPWDGLQSFGTIDVTAEALEVALWGIDGRARYRVAIPWEPPAA